MTRSVSIVIPTLRRHASLARALRSIAAQRGVTRDLLEVVVVDNSPEGSAAAVVAEAGRFAPAPVRYVHEPHPGVATARNAGLRAAQGALIAFLDDDEEAPADWLAALLRAHRATAADVTFGPVRACIPAEGGWARAHFEALFSRTGPAESGLIDQAYGCGNSLMTRATALPGPAPFDERRNEGGGEDDSLFAELAAQGRRFGWAADAVVLEHPAPHRLSLRYAAQRAFAFGQGPSQIAAERREWLKLARWTAVGLAQTAVFGTLTAGLWLLRDRRWPQAMDRALRGLGKVLWIGALEPRFYGQAEASRSALALAAIGS